MTTNRPNLSPIIVIFLLIPCLTACDTLTQFIAPSPPHHDPAFVACQAFKVITFDRVADTTQTIAQIKQHNAAYLALCPPPPAPIRQQATAGEAEFK